MIWPPLDTSFNRPLGIPFLLAYLRRQGLGGIAVLDINRRFLESWRGFRVIRGIRRWYDRLAGRISRGSPRVPATAGTTGSPGINAGGRRSLPFWKKFGVRAHRRLEGWLDNRFSGVLHRIREEIPWSLDGIISLALAGDGPGARARIRRLAAEAVGYRLPGWAAISVIYPEQLYYALEISRLLKELSGGKTVVVLGGAQITKHARQITEHEGISGIVDYMVAGDGELPLYRLLSGPGPEDPGDVPNLYFRDPETAAGFRRSRTSFSLSPEDFLVPDFEGFAGPFYHGWWPILVSKGCFWARCSFCTYAAMQDSRCRIGTPEKTVSVMAEMSRAGSARKFRFVDDALPPGFLGKMAPLLKQNLPGCAWRTSLVLSGHFADREFCRELKSSGLARVTIGLESAVPRVLKKMNKYHRDMTESDIVPVLEALTSAGIKVGLHIIFGFPTETEEEARRTLSFLLRHREVYDVCWVQPFCLEEGTPVFQRFREFGISRIHYGDKNSGERLGYRYEVSAGMSQEEARRFTYEIALPALKQAGVAG